MTMETNKFMTEQSKEPQFGRAFNAAINSDWMITEEAFRSMLKVAARMELPVPVAVDPDAQPSGWESRRDEVVEVRNGVAIIPINGPIFRYAGFFTYYCGGTSVDRLARNLKAAINDPRVSSIMFEINSPGGEVTGISEFSEMVYRARSQKPITARVGGMGCSAAYWIASMCGDIAIDKTAILGSIGVMAVYLDDTKQLEMRGLEEIEFISTQSPYKNAAPSSDEGRNRIQKRIDALADVFVNAVAVGRGVSVKTVLDNFGQGDVFVGQAAVDAGLADRIASFSSTIETLASTHTVGYVAGEEYEEFPQPIEDAPAEDPEGSDGEDEAIATINNSSAVNSSTVDSGIELAEHFQENGELMKDQETPETAEAGTEATTAAEPVTTDEASDKAKAVPENSATELADNSELAGQLKEANTRIAQLEEAATSKWLDEQTAEMAGDRDNHRTVLSALESAHGKDSDVVKAYIENQTALSEQIKESGLFAELGKGSANTENAAEAKVDKLAKDLAASSGVSYERAYATVLEKNPDLANEVL